MTRKKKKAKKVTSVDDLSNFSSGKIEDEDIRKTKELEEALGIKHVNPFGTNDPKIFEEKLNDSNLADLQRLCQKVGIFPSHEKSRLKDSLKKEFARITKGSRTIVLQQELDIMHPDHPDHQKAKNIIEGF